MATLTVSAATNMANPQVFFGTVTAATANRITISDGNLTANYLGNFSYTGFSILGTLTGYQVFQNGFQVTNATGFSVDANTAFTLIDSLQFQAVYGLVFAGNDTIIGSPYGDVLLAYDGDDTLRGAGGDDILDGGAGHDSVTYALTSRLFTVSASGENVVVRNRADYLEGRDTLANVEHVLFADGATFDPRWLVQATKLDHARYVDLIDMYVAYFDRAPDALGIQYWASRLVEGMTLQQIAKSFFVQPETIAAYPPTMSTTQFVTQVYQNALGRAPDAGGLAYWVNDLEIGAQTRDAFMLAIIYGARAPTGNPADAAYLRNKGEVGKYFALTKGLGDAGWASQVMAGVTGDMSTVVAADAQIDHFASIAVTTDQHLLVPLVGVAS